MPFICHHLTLGQERPASSKLSLAMDAVGLELASVQKEQRSRARRQRHRGLIPARPPGPVLLGVGLPHDPILQSQGGGGKDLG